MKAKLELLLYAIISRMHLSIVEPSNLKLVINFLERRSFHSSFSSNTNDGLMLIHLFQSKTTTEWLFNDNNDNNGQ